MCLLQHKLEKASAPKEELEARIEALFRCWTRLAAIVEMRLGMDGHELQEALLDARPGGEPMKDRVAQILDEVVKVLSAARAMRRTSEMWSKNRADQTPE